MAQWPDMIELTACDPEGVNEFPVLIAPGHIRAVENWNAPMVKILMVGGQLYWAKAASNPGLRSMPKQTDTWERSRASGLGIEFVKSPEQEAREYQDKVSQDKA